MFGKRPLERSWNAGTYQLTKYRRPEVKLPMACCEWCDSRLRTLSESVERLEKTLVDLTAGPKELGDPSTRLQMDTALKMLEHAINSDASYGDLLLTHPETMTNAFKAYHNAVGAVLAQSPPTPATDTRAQMGYRTTSCRWVRVISPTKPRVSGRHTKLMRKFERY